ncbi:chromate transporter [Aquibacillus albus]|uniref:Chromate transporter n=2 Tax=Aquibacillus albus TaxID=1168171 RepID=A0ABS2MVX7_9BACI|nr:chromate transporter [Aquibacillus albus]
MLGYGGGPSSIPLVHKEVVDRFKWLSDEEFSDILAIGNTLPGPIATKMAGYIGYRVGGVTGAINAVLATILPTVILMILFIGFLIKYRESAIVQGITHSIIPVVTVMLGSLAYKFFKQSHDKLGKKGLLLLGGISFICFVLLNIHPAILIAVLLIYSLVKKTKREQKPEKQTGVS